MSLSRGTFVIFVRSKLHAELKCVVLSKATENYKFWLFLKGTRVMQVQIEHNLSLIVKVKYRPCYMSVVSDDTLG